MEALILDAVPRVRLGEAELLASLKKGAMAKRAGPVADMILSAIAEKLKRACRKLFATRERASGEGGVP